MSLPTDIQKNRQAFLKSAEYINKSPRTQLKVLAHSTEFRDDVGFLVDGNRLPFSDDVNKKLKNSLKQWKMATSPNKAWDEFYRETRINLKNLKELHRDRINSEERLILQNTHDRKHNLVLLARSIKTTKAAKEAGIIFEKSTSGCGDAMKCMKEKAFIAVLKSTNGDPGTIDNPKSICHPLAHNFAKPCRNYQSAQKEAFAYDLAVALELAHTIPPTILTLIENEHFHTLFDNVSAKNFLNEFPEHEEAVKFRLGKVSKERLCSLQRAIPNAITLEAFEKTEMQINQKSFEDVILITRILGETDGHKKNFLVRNIHNEYYLIKIDSGFSFPRKNAGALNSLINLDNAEKNVSASYQKKTLSINIDTLKKIARQYKLHDDCIDAAVERIKFMKLLNKVIPMITHLEFELRLRMFTGYKLENEIRKSFELKKNTPITKDIRINFALGVYTKKEIENYKRTILFGKEAIENDSYEQSNDEGYIFKFEELDQKNDEKSDKML